MEWIKCSDRLPENEVDVIVLWFKNSIYRAVYIGYFDGDEWHLQLSDYNHKQFNNEHVTHWMPLPELPK